MWISKRLRQALIAAAMMALWTMSHAQQETADEPGAAVIEPPAIEALEKMGAYLRSLKAFELQAETLVDEVLESGQKIQFGGTITYRVQPPDKLFADVASDRKQRQYFYDGKTFTIYAPRMKYYAVFDAPPTIRETIDAAQEKYALETPLADLFIWGTDEADTESITSALIIGPSQVNGEWCEHFAYRQPDVDWQLWVRQGEQPLPCKLVITTINEEGQPQYSSVMTWNPSPSIDAGAFTFKPPEGAHQIAIREAEQPAEAATQN